jgi:hypothetical protein
MDNQVAVIAIGALLVAANSWSRFDEPSYASATEFFARYQPRFSTSHSRYVRARLGYVLAIVLVYVLFNLVPEFFESFNASPIKGSVPFGIALAMITLQNVPSLKDLEQRIRGFLHSFAQVPDGVRRTVSELRGSPFNFSSQAFSAQTRKLNLPQTNDRQPVAIREQIVRDDELLLTWYTTGCILFALSDGNRDKIGIDPLFYEYYKDELDVISSKHLALSHIVRRHLEGIHAAERSEETSSIAEAAVAETRKLRDRLYTFLACGIHSSLEKDGSKRFEISNRLGFSLPQPTPGGGIPFSPIAGASFIALLIVSVFSAYFTQQFREYVLEPLGTWAGGFPVPKQDIEIYFWSSSSAAYYLATVLTVLAVRDHRILKREWFDLNNFDRARPILRYIAPVLVSTAVGVLVLSLISIVGGPAFSGSFRNLAGPVREAVVWFPLAAVLACTIIAISDSRLIDERPALRICLRALLGASAMGLMGFFVGHFVVTNKINEFAANSALDLKLYPEISPAKWYFSLFIAGQVWFLVFVLCIIVQIAEHLSLIAKSLRGKQIEVRMRDDVRYRIVFHNSGQAKLTSAYDGNLNVPSRNGTWLQFPEGTAIKWSYQHDGQARREADFGLVSTYGDSMIYEGYVSSFGRSPDIVAQVRLLNGHDGPVQQVEVPANLRIAS